MTALVAFLLFFQAPNFSADGLKALEDQKYEAAVQAFTKAVEADPKDFYAHFNLGLAYTFLHKDAEALAEFHKTLEIQPGLYEAQLNAGILFLRVKNPVEAAPLLAKAVEQKPKEFRPRLFLSQAQLANGDAAGAAAGFQAAIEIDPKSAAAQLGLGQALARQGKLEDAAPHFRDAARLDPEYRDALLELAALYEQNKQLSEAVEIYRQFPEDPAAQERMGELMLETKQYADAVPRLEEAYSKSPTEANRAALAAAYVFNKQLDKAVPLLDKAVAAQPANYDLRMMYARALRDQRQFQPAARHFYEALKLKPDSRETWNELAVMLYLNSDYAQALAAFDKARQLGEDTPGNWYFRAIILDKLHQQKPALEAYQRFLSISEGKHPDEEFKARQRARIIQRELSKK